MAESLESYAEWEKSQSPKITYEMITLYNILKMTELQKCNRLVIARGEGVGMGGLRGMAMAVKERVFAGMEIIFCTWTISVIIFWL